MQDREPSLARVPRTILDSGVMPARVRKTLVNVIAGFQGGIVAVGLLIIVGRQANSHMDPGLDLLSFFSVLAIAVTVHELGHLLTGWAVGFRFSSIQVGPLSLSIEHGILKVRFRLEMAAMGYAGMHVNRLSRLRRRLIFYIAAGPAANFIFAAVTVYVFNNGFPELGRSWVATPVAQFVFASLLLGILSLIPHQSFLMSDGARIRMLLRSRDGSRRWLSICAIGKISNSGVRAKNWKRTWLRSAALVPDTSADAFAGNWLSYVSANDRKDSSVAASHLEKCLELTRILPVSTRDVIAQEAAVFAAWFRDDASLAERWIAQLKKPESLQRFVQIRLNVAVRCARRDYDGAEKAWQDGIVFIEKATDGPAHERMRVAWLDWQEEILARKACGIAVRSASV